MSDRAPSTAQVIMTALDRRLAGVRVMLPARVERFDSIKMTVDVQPLLTEALEGADGDSIEVALPVITAVPVVFPGGGGMRITFPIAAGDTGSVVFSDRSLDVWASGGGGPVDPRDGRRHDLSDAIFFPGLNPTNKAWGGFENSVVTLGSENGASEFVATAQRVLTELSKIKNAYDGHTHVVSTTGTASAQSGTAAAPSPSPALTAPASATVKIRG